MGGAAIFPFCSTPLPAINERPLGDMRHTILGEGESELGRSHFSNQTGGHNNFFNSPVQHSVPHQEPQERLGGSERVTLVT